MKQITGVLRTDKLHLERRIEMVIPQSHPVISWLVGYAAWMITVRVVGHGVHTACERIRHKHFAKRLVPFGEAVQMYLPAKGPERLACGTLDARTKIRVVLGYGTQSHSYVWCSLRGVWLLSLHIPEVSGEPVVRREVAGGQRYQQRPARS